MVLLRTNSCPKSLANMAASERTRLAGLWYELLLWLLRDTLFFCSPRGNCLSCLSEPLVRRRALLVRRWALLWPSLLYWTSLRPAVMSARSRKQLSSKGVSSQSAAWLKEVLVREKKCLCGDPFRKVMVWTKCAVRKHPTSFEMQNDQPLWWIDPNPVINTTYPISAPIRLLFRQCRALLSGKNSASTNVSFGSIFMLCRIYIYIYICVCNYSCRFLPE